MTADAVGRANAGFPVVWDDPADAAISWAQARLHYPRPVSVLTHELRKLGQDTGMARADEALERPSERLSRRINTYHYRGVRPLLRDADWLTARRLRAEARYMAVARRVGDVWREHVPEVEAALAALDRADVERMDRGALLVELALAIARSARLWEIHFLVMPSVLVAMASFTELYRELFDDGTELDALRLLQGVETKTVEAARGIWALARVAGAEPGVRDLFERTDHSELVDALEESPFAAGFLTELRDYMGRYGRRGITMDPADPSVLEQPDTVLAEVRSTLVSGRDPETQLAAVRAERDRAIGETLERLRGYPGPVVDEFRALLAAGQDGVMVQETHNFYIDFGLAYRLRRIILAAARALMVEGTIRERDDIFHLDLVELREALEGRPAADLAARVAARRDEIERFGRIDPPSHLGAPPPPVGSSVLERAGAGFAGLAPPASEAGTVRGHPGSPGRARGTARVVHAPTEATRVGVGDVLVTEMTAAPWTPLFSRIAALVTDSGGALSHSAIVAREYGIPAVVGTARGTLLIPEGAMVEVDGDQGVVRIVDRT